jgi:predicted PurR-regulated permease PerM
MGQRTSFYIVAAAIFVLSVILSLYFTKAFITTLLFSVFIVYILDPMYIYLLSFIKNKSISALITVLATSSIILYLLFFAARNLIYEVSSLVRLSAVPNYLAEPNLTQAIITLVARYFPNTAIYLLDGIPSAIASNVVGHLKTFISAFISNMPIYIAQLILLVFFTYYFFIDGKNIIKKLIELLPEKEVVNHFFNELNLIYNIFFRIHLLIAVIDAIIGAVGFYIMGIPFPITWGIVLGFFNFIPELGPSAVFIPISIYYLIIHDYSRAFGVFIFGEIFLVLIPEYIIRPRLVLIGASVHPLLTILAFTAPIFIIGPAGVIVGPAVYGISLAGYRTLLFVRNRKSQRMINDYPDLQEGEKLEGQPQ